MKLAQYTSQERVIATADSSGIRQRWMYGLRLLADTEKIATAGGLKHGVAESLIQSAAKHGIKLSAREIRWRMQLARAYPTEAQIGNAITDFNSWFDLIQAGFPDIAMPAGEPPADWRTQAEKDHDSARALADLIGDQGTLFPLSKFEPAEITLKDLEDYAEQQDRINAGFIETSRKRHEYLGSLTRAVNGDMSKTWAEAQAALDAAA
jgi:hypothetical protein